MAKYPDIKVILVDDEKTCLKIIKSFILESELLQPHNLVPLSTSLEAIEHLKNQPADLLITDYCMPYMTGDILVESAKKTCPGIKTILFTAVKIRETPTCRADIESVPDIFMEKISHSEKDEFINTLDSLCKTINKK